VISPVASTTITVVKTVFGICTVRAVNTGTILVTKRATGVCTVRAANTGGLSVSRFRGTCTARTLNSGTIKVTRFIAGASTAIATNTGTLKSFRIMAGTATGRTANAGSLTIPFSPVALVGTDTVRTLNAGTLKVTKPLIGESMLPISVVQFAGGFNAGLHSSFLVVFATNPVPGNLILTLVEWKTTGSPTVTASGGATNIWTQIGPTFDGSYQPRSQTIF
jgi:hypothetical protein